MTAAMLAAGWTPQYNLFGTLTHWRHENGVTVSHETVVKHWRVAGSTPPPF